MTTHKGLDLEHWIILGETPQKTGNTVIVMKRKGQCLYCTQYAGSGQYFDSLIDLITYASKRGWTPLQIDEREA